MRLRKLLLLIPLSLLIGCQPIERQAYNTVVASKAFLDSVKVAHPECPAATSALCSVLTRATAAKDVLIDAGEAYCNVAQFDASDTTPCNPPAKGTPAYQQVFDRLQSAMSIYKLTESDLKGAIQ